jgi:hypothetical protein
MLHNQRHAGGLVKGESLPSHFIARAICEHTSARGGERFDAQISAHAMSFVRLVLLGRIRVHERARRVRSRQQSFLVPEPSQPADVQARARSGGILSP